MPMLLEMIESLWLRIGPILNYDFRSNSSRVKEHVSVAHHERIVSALALGDAQVASQALAGDLQGAADFIVSAGVLLADSPEEAQQTPWLTDCRILARSTGSASPLQGTHPRLA